MPDLTYFPVGCLFSWVSHPVVSPWECVIGGAVTKIVLAGASGLIGTALHRALVERGENVVRLVRRPIRHPGEMEWDPASGRLGPDALMGARAVIALNGASVGRLPWTPRYRRTLMVSRLQATRAIAACLRELGSDAPAFLSGSAVGFYGSRLGEPLTEGSSPGDTFLARLCVFWEREALAVSDITRVTLLRTAPVMHPQGVLQPLMRLTSLGLAGPLGRGTQVWPWISLEDEVRGILHALDSQLSGPVNLTGPLPATATEIGRELARQMRRPFWLPAPEWALNIALSRDAVESLLTSNAQVQPEALLDSGFTFSHPTPQAAIRAALHPA